MPFVILRDTALEPEIIRKEDSYEYPVEKDCCLDNDNVPCGRLRDPHVWGEKSFIHQCY